MSKAFDIAVLCCLSALLLLTVLKARRLHLQGAAFWSQFGPQVASGLLTALFVLFLGAELNHAETVNGNAAQARNAQERNTIASGVPLSAMQLNRVFDPGVYLDNRTMIGASFDGADVASASLDSGNASFAHFVGANLAGSSMIDTELSWADLEGASLDAADLSNVDAAYADFDGVLAAHVAAPDACFSGASFEWSSLESGSFQGDSFEDASLIGANLADADLTGSDLAGANLSGADLTGANLSGVEYSSSTQWPAGALVARSFSGGAGNAACGRT